MPGSTTRFGWPFPLPTDLIANGASTIGQMAQAIENQITLADNAFAAGDLIGGYPLGWSMMTVTAPASAGGWPTPNTGAAIVLTFRGSGVGFQFYLSSASLPYGYQMRWIGSGSASAWVPVNGIIPQDTWAAAEPSTSYPPGNTSMAVSSGNFAALGWPVGAGQVTTYRNSSGSVAYQFYMVTNQAQLLYRWFGTTPGPWNTLWGAGVATAQAGGQISSAAITPNAVTAIPVTFPAGRFASTPRVSLSLATAFPQNYSPLAHASISATGMTVNVFSPTASAVSFLWTAIQGVG